MPVFLVDVPVILAWAEYGLDGAIIVFVGYVLSNASVQNILQPGMMGNGAGLLADMMARHRRGRPSFT